MHQKKKKKKNRTKRLIAGCICYLKTKADVPFVLRPNKWLSLKLLNTFLSLLFTVLKKLKLKMLV